MAHLTTTHWDICSQRQCQTLVRPLPPPKNPSNQMPPTSRQSKDSFKCSPRQSVPASPPATAMTPPEWMQPWPAMRQKQQRRQQQRQRGGGYSGGGGSGGNANGGGGGNGGYYGNGSGNGGNQTPSGPLPVKQYKNWNFCFTHGGNVNNNYTSATCACPSENHQCMATHTNTMGANLCYMNKNVFPSTISRRPAPTCPPPLPLKYAPTLSFPISTNGLTLPSASSSWGFGPHNGAYQQAKNIPPQPSQAMMHNTMVYINAYQQAPHPARSSCPIQSELV